MKPASTELVAVSALTIGVEYIFIGMAYNEPDGSRTAPTGVEQMNQLLQESFESAAKLPEGEQDRFARFLLGELESERRWAELFARTESEDLLERLADEVIVEHRAGASQPLTAEDL